MTDALSALEKISEDAAKLTEVLQRTRAKTIPPNVVQPTVRVIARIYFEMIRPELDATKQRAGLVDEIDFVLQQLLQLAITVRERQAYIGQLNELHPYLMEATVDLMKARGAARLLLSDTERAILQTLNKLLPGAAASYEQSLRDISLGSRISWRGTANELREALREVIDHFAPDEKVMTVPGFQLETNQTLPTQKQKVRFILKARRSSKSAIAVSEESLEIVEGAIASLARLTYQRGNASAHSNTDGSEIRKLKRYVDALMAELLEIS